MTEWETVRFVVSAVIFLPSLFAALVCATEDEWGYAGLLALIAALDFGWMWDR